MKIRITTIVSDTNVTHYFKTLLKQVVKKYSTIEWE